ncbi:delta-lactam-biosynthetic de-N-acetylase [Salimicrobium halophilum]|uniref:Peptidoglycan-N-acetylmuramic acid deacetylase n=1 Tax=Salimicrobium halophilum TaxID=86666 RepID=A0A1G8U7B6_9BACI|nr:delta-lactam-biosynthetic de-N-acetylase [Salimicrobium halophilum]SDJ49514.1 peptidoglycan-N-acetylmuramic acid deacetylase [Salimicrobium halophilum]
MMRKLMILCIFILCLPTVGYAESWGYKKSDEKEVAPEFGRYTSLVEPFDALYKGNGENRKIYLTFDNGYEQGYTEEVLQVLRKKDVPATFFLTGHYVKSAPELVKQMNRDGHLIGNHSYSHRDFTTLSKEELKQDVKKLEEEVKKLTSQETMTFLRPPKGTFNERSLEWTREMGYIHAFWSLAFVDWNTDRQKGWEHAYQTLVEQVHPGAVVLLHTVSEDNKDALAPFIDEMRKRGYEFGTLNELLAQENVLLPMSGIR